MKALVPVAWADGVFADTEKQMIEALLDAYGATEAERTTLRDYASTKRTLEDIDIQELSADDRRVLFQHAVLLSFADGAQSPDELAFLHQLAQKLRMPNDETAALLAAGAQRAKKFLHLI